MSISNDDIYYTTRICCIYIYIYIYVYIYTCVCVCVYVYVCVCVVYIYIYIYICIYIRMTTNYTHPHNICFQESVYLFEYVRMCVDVCT